MSVINQSEIIKRMGNNISWNKRLVIEPLFDFPDTNDNVSASFDFHLGNRFVIFRKRRDVQHDPLNITSKKDATTQEYFVSFGDHFVIHPGQLVLGTTLEWFCFPLDLMAYVIERSIWGRRGLIIATATAVQPGSKGIITLELCNTGEMAVILKPGVRIGQLFFHKVDPAKPNAFITSFAGALRPSIGDYKKSASERFLIKPQKRY